MWWEIIAHEIFANLFKKLLSFSVSFNVTLDLLIDIPDIVSALNDDMLNFLSMPILTGKNKGEVCGSTVKVDGAYKVLKQMIKKNMKLVKPLDKKSLDAFFYLHVYDLALIGHENREFRKKLKIKKGFFG